MRRNKNENCVACFVKDCKCRCDTCNRCRERNSIMSQTELTELNMADAKEYDRINNDNN